MLVSVGGNGRAAVVKFRCVRERKIVRGADVSCTQVEGRRLGRGKGS